ncbi:MAG TPA: phosphotransferase family protein [Candidatus Binatia bacterium]|nr:phosphotransferase family protein [Candidatus Binatia bacterium]
MIQAPLDAPGAVRDENAFDPQRVLPFLRSQVAGLPDGPLELKQFQGGASNVTYQLGVGGREMILRRPPAGTKPKSGHDMHREFRVMQALHPHFPCPKPLAYTDDASLIGAPFYVMEKVGGIILRRDLPKGLAYSPEQSRRLCLNLVDTLIRLHTLDYAAIGLADLGHPEGYVARQVKGWCERFEKAWTDDVPKCETLMAWLKAHQPADSPRPGIIHNDYRFDNAILDPADALTIIGVLDWEMCTIGDPLMDLGGTLAYWIQAGDPPHMQAVRMQPSNLPGMLTREEIVAYYGEKTGRTIGNWDFYYVFGLFRLAVIAQQIYYRWKMGQTKNPRFQAFGMFVSVLAQVSDAVIGKSKL